MAVPLRVLLLEDSPADAELMMNELHHYGYDAVCLRVDTEREFVRQLEPSLDAPEVILSDYQLPSFNGLRALQLVRERGLDMPFILISGAIGEELAVEALKCGATDYLLKDRMARLGPAVHAALEQHRLLAESRRAAGVLTEQDRRFRIMVENSGDGIVLLDGQGTVLYTSPAAERIIGGSAESRLGTLWLDRLHPDDLPAGARVFRQLLGTPGGVASLEYRYRHLDGSWRWLETVASNLLADPGVRAIVGNFRDVTERKNTRDALAASETELRALFAAMTDIVVVLDAQGRYQHIAPTNRAGLAKAPDELLGRTVHEVLPAEEADQILQTIRTALQAQQPSPVEYALTIGDAKVWFEATVSPLGTDQVIWVARDVTERKRVEAQTQRHAARLSAQRNIDLAISGSFDLRTILNVLLRQVVEQLGIDAAGILLLDPASQRLDFGAGLGFRTKKLEHLSLRVGQGFGGRAALERRTVRIPNIAAVAAEVVRTTLLTDEAFVTYFGVPLVAKGKVKGVLEVFQRSPIEPDAEWMDFLEALAGQAAIAIDNAELFNGLQRSNVDLALAYDSTLEGWSHALDLRDKETEGHSRRVTELTVRLARDTGMTGDELLQVRRGTLLHDIGKMGVPDHILLKPGPLTEDEWVAMRKHPSYAFELLSPIAFLRPALDIPYCHHEKWDGTGYPRGLKGEQIPLSARLFAIVDVWDALRSDRPYRAAWPADKVHAHIRSLSGSHFDPAVVSMFLDMVA